MIATYYNLISFHSLSNLLIIIHIVLKLIFAAGRLRPMPLSCHSQFQGTMWWMRKNEDIPKHTKLRRNNLFKLELLMRRLVVLSVFLIMDIFISCMVKRRYTLINALNKLKKQNYLTSRNVMVQNQTTQNSPHFHLLSNLKNAFDEVCIVMCLL